ncbi:MAG: phosphoribosylanthranilate isomerase [Tepidanaerobacteraceae bacterium]|jgi:phosphoribosylanthranilate isomerase|nr:phosphoribosylanthranilate isomerase [Tepidanaerobacteraceae bacterium]
MVAVKICGLRRPEDINYANLLRPDYAGFVFAPGKRRISFEEAEQLISILDKRIKRVGVFLNERRDVILEACEQLDLDVIQLHGDEPPESVKGYGKVAVWKAIRVENADSLKTAKDYEVNGILLDSAAKGLYGGSGVRFSLDLLEGVQFRQKVILAGGLDAENVAEAILKARPHAVDVSSGVETGGFKDFEKMKKFVERVRSL